MCRCWYNVEQSDEGAMLEGSRVAPRTQMDRWPPLGASHPVSYCSCHLLPQGGRGHQSSCMAIDIVDGVTCPGVAIGSDTCSSSG